MSRSQHCHFKFAFLPLVLCAISSAWASSSSCQSQYGPYMGLELGGASLNSPYKEYDYRTYRNITKTISSTDFALAYNLGYMFNSYFGVEAVVWDMIGEENYFGDNNNSIIAGVMLKINYPFGDRFNIYARLGGGFLISTYSYESIYPDYDEITERTDAHTALLYGFGISFYPAAHHEIGLNYRGSLSENIYKKGLEENAPNHTLIDAYTLSYAYHFRY